MSQVFLLTRAKNHILHLSKKEVKRLESAETDSEKQFCRGRLSALEDALDLLKLFEHEAVNGKS